jgi:hypothetical protein
MDDRGFIVPPPGLIPSRPEPAVPDREAASAGRPLPAFVPPSAPGAPVPPARPVWRLLLPGGRSVPITRTVLLGRNPSRAQADGDAEAIALEDPTSTVSKTHAALALQGDDLTVTDLHSTNGVLVAGTRATPGRPVVVADGAELLLGDYRVSVERA